MKKAYGYTRTATIKQAEEQNSNESQAERIRNYCKANNIKLVRVYSDNAQSGSSSNNPGLTELIEHVVKSPVDYVVVAEIDRLSRKFTDYLAIKVYLQRRGVEIKATGGSPVTMLYEGMLKDILSSVKALNPKVSTKNEKKL